MTRLVSRSFAALLVLALVAAAPVQAYADNGHRRGHGHGHHHGGGHHHHRGHYGYPRPGFVVGVLPSHHHVVHRWGVPYYYGAGAWYRPYGPRFVVVGAPLGVIVPFLPPFYTTIWVGGVPYYCAGDTYYQAVPGGYAVVSAPPSLPPQPGGYYEGDDEDLYAYPGRGQSESRQSDDRYACHRWAVDQTGFDPTRALEGAQETSAGGSRADYQRAMAACLEARGYTVR